MGQKRQNNKGEYAVESVEVKVKVTPEQATKAQRGSSGVVLLFL